MAKPKIVLFDLETLPNIRKIAERIPSIGAWPGRTMKADINSIICFGYKIEGHKKAKCINAWDFPKRWKANRNDDYDVVKAAYDILKDADGIVTHNGKKFDIKVLNTRLKFHGLPSLPKIPHMDTVLASRRHLSLYSNRLDDLATFLGVENKLENGGWDLWVQIMFDDTKKSKDLMAKYCKQDVEVLHQVYDKMRPHFTNIPNYNLWAGTEHNCPSCGSVKVQKHGIRATKTAMIQRYRCLDCGSTSSGTTTKTSLRNC